MEKPLTITAVCGWAIPADWFAALVESCLPGAAVRAVYPLRPSDPEEARALLNDSSNLYIGYSLGSLWLLHHRRCLAETARKALLAPILAFTREHKMGGKTPAGQLKYLLKRLARNDKDNAPLYDFYSHCDLPSREDFFQTLPARSALIEGLEFLGNIKSSGEAARDFLPLLGDRDPFLDSVELKRHIPHLQIVEGAGHSPHDLLRGLAERLASWQETTSVHQNRPEQG
ncbi:MAG: hypothetical protein ACE5G9_07845 [Nitrospinales bacterium]